MTGLDDRTTIKDDDSSFSSSLVALCTFAVELMMESESTDIEPSQGTTVTFADGSELTVPISTAKLGPQ